MKDMLQDLKDEQETLDRIVATLDKDGWETITPAQWTVKQQIEHLAFFDNTARLAVTEPENFNEHAKALFDGRPEAMAQLNVLTEMAPSELLHWWRTERTALIEALSPKDARDRIPWYGPSMSALSFATARLMETWAHGQDVVHATRAIRPATDRLRHIAHLGYVTFGWSFLNRQMEVPRDPVRLELTSPSGDQWTWGPEEASNFIRGSAKGFCLVVVQRRHYLDTDLVVTGPIAEKWMSVAQCFAGPATLGPPPGKFHQK